jgi:transcription termination factor NusB
MKFSNIENEKTLFLIINQAVEFSKKYLDFEKFKYINKILDIVAKEESSKLKTII